MAIMAKVDALESAHNKLTQMRSLLILFMRSYGQFEGKGTGYQLLSDTDKELIEVNLVTLHDMMWDELEALDKAIDEAYKGAKGAGSLTPTDGKEAG